MKQKPNLPPSGGDIQVFELTMDNPEDKDELNRRLRKPGESQSDAPPKNGNVIPAEPTAEANRDRYPGP
jgi:hypothetical protein